MMDQLTNQAQDFDALQDRLVAIWPAIAAPTDAAKTMVAVPSVSMDFPPELAPLMPAYEERFLFLLLLLAQPRARVVYVTAQPISPRIVDYYLSLVPGDIDPSDVRDRLAMVSIGDPSPRPLTAKILERPRTIERIRRLMGDPSQAHIVPFTTTDLEERLAVALGIPMYGASPKVLRHGTKSGSRRIFEAEGVAHPRGAADLTSIDEVVSAIDSLAASDTPPGAMVVKMNEGIGGFGNAIVDLDGASTTEEIRERVLSLKPIGDMHDPAEFLELFANNGGVVEERVSGRDIRSPSVQLRISPSGEVEMLSTHDQVLGGAEGQSYFGARFPADTAYAHTIAQEAMKVGRRLAAEGVIGRFAVDFVVVATDEGWEAFAIEINIRKGGTTHPFLTLQLLTDGSYDAETGQFICSTGRKHYVATDHLEGDGFSTLTSDDLLDLVEKEGGLGWDPISETGVVFHMISALPAAGRIGLTAIGNSAEEADEMNALAERILSNAARG